jgi:hypothetical protein
MKNLFSALPVCVKRSFFVLLASVFLSTLVALAPTAFAEHTQKKADLEALRGPELPSTTFTYQGELKDANGPANGVYELQFILYTAQTGGDELGSVVHENTVLTNGLFTVQLDFGSAINSHESWLEIAVRPGDSTDAYTVLSPRQRLTPTPYAIFARQGEWSLVGMPVGVADSVDNDVPSVNVPGQQKVRKPIEPGDLGNPTYCEATTTTQLFGSWNLKGNAGINSASDFLGTRDNVGLAIRTNNVERMRIDSSGNVGIGTTTPGASLDIVRGGGSFATTLSVANTNNTRATRSSVVLRAAFDGSAGSAYFDSNLGGHAYSVGTGPLEGGVGNFSIKDGTATANQIRFLINSSGNVGIGTTTPAYKLDVIGVIRGTNVSPSDARLKTKIAPLTNALEKLEQIRGVAFEWNETSASLGHTPGQKDIGVIAQEVEAIFPEVVSTSSTDGYKAVDYSRLTAVLIEAVKELKAENEGLKQRIELLERGKGRK